MSLRAKIVTAILLCAAVFGGIYALRQGLPEPRPHVKVQLAGADELVEVLHDAGSDAVVFRVRGGGQEELLTPEVFAARVLEEQAARPNWQRILNITSAAGLGWVLIGLGGQILFSGRMVVQWIVSEKERRSVVPLAFWWLALGGASMLLLYFVWRKDIVGILGQATGWLIYTRNLYLIYGERRELRRAAA